MFHIFPAITKTVLLNNLTWLFGWELTPELLLREVYLSAFKRSVPLKICMAEGWIILLDLSVVISQTIVCKRREEWERESWVGTGPAGRKNLADFYQIKIKNRRYQKYDFRPLKRKKIGTWGESFSGTCRWVWSREWVLRRGN